MNISAKYSYINGLFAKGDDNAEFDFVVPGFVDIHCHGGGGKYFSENAPIAIETHRKAGTCIQLASLVTQGIETLKSQIEYLKHQDIYGIHLEGPYLSTKYCGAHDPKLLKPPTISEIKELLAVGEGSIKFITIAPELPGALEAIKYLANHDVVVAIGHSNANASETRDAISAGAKVVTHFNNGMAKLGSVDSLSQVALESDIYLEQIQDGHHLSKSDSFTIATRASNRLVAVTDAMSAAGYQDGEYEIGSLSVTVHDGAARLKGTSTLAGSTLTMLKAFFNYVEIVGMEQAVKFTSLNPSKILGINPYASYIGIKGSQVTHLIS